MTTPAKWKPPTCPRAVGPMTELDPAAIRARAEAATYFGGDEQVLADDTLALLDEVDALSAKVGDATIALLAAEEEVERLRAERDELAKQVKRLLDDDADDAQFIARTVAERDEARATKNMHKERQEEYLARAERAEAERDAARAVIERVRALVDGPYTRWVESGPEGGPAMVSAAVLRAILAAAGGPMTRAEDAAREAYPGEYGGAAFHAAFVAGWQAALASIDRERAADRIYDTYGQRDRGRSLRIVDAVIEAIREDS